MRIEFRGEGDDPRDSELISVSYEVMVPEEMGLNCDVEFSVNRVSDRIDAWEILVKPKLPYRSGKCILDMCNHQTSEDIGELVKEIWVWEAKNSFKEAFAEAMFDCMRDWFNRRKSNRTKQSQSEIQDESIIKKIDKVTQ